MDKIELLAEFILQSDLIEGIKDSRGDLEEEIMLKKQDGHAGAILYLESLAEDKSYFLSEEDIKKVQGWITEEQGEKRPDLRLRPEWIGNYRNIGVRVGERICPDYSKAPGLMKNLALQIQEWQKRQPSLTEEQNISLIADFYFDFEIIHPFADGNGRTGRVIVFYLMRYLGREPFVFTDAEKYWMHFPALKNQERLAMRKYFYQKSGLI